ncbi:MAG: stage V sporulation protein AA [Defluviitaleaceae bacterium]|nr:stage V sporulation protein AA [Defluviitaleaceae bacterium]MCL2262950.1 stage V sporulation protein AA [Defluviitaleaceae bacterium]
MEIYIKPKKKADLLNREEILIGDVAEVVAPAASELKIVRMKLKSIESGKGAKNYLVPVTDIIKKISTAYPDATINNVGETDTWVHTVTRRRREIPMFLWAKVAFVSVVLFVGAATAIMSFHTDGQIPKIFERYYTMFYGTTVSNPPIIVIPYSIGLALGIIVFYNHFFGRKITDDPTPIEVEIETYEAEVAAVMVATLEKDGDDSDA